MRRAAASLISAAAARAAAPASSAATTGGAAKQSVGGASAVFGRTFAADAATADSGEALKKTPLYDMHVAAGGKMVPFAGWSMPIQYTDSIMDSTKHCRSAASLFDVSHMCGLTLKGKDAIPFLESLVVGDVAGITPGTGSLSVFTNERGGIIDDTVVTKVADDEVYLVVNAGCRDKDLAHIGSHLAAARGAGKDVHLTVHDDRALLALQGPAAAAVLAPYATGVDLGRLYFSHFVRAPLAGLTGDAWVTRTGYTGEDGFELSIPAGDAVKVAAALVGDGSRTRLCGLGARDALRLEAGLCLYGNDLNEDISPVEAGLAWTIGKARREACSFLGGDVIKKQLADGVAVRRVGLVVPSGAPPRQHADILDAAGNRVGEVTSGAFSPCLKTNIAMGYVPKQHAKAGTELQVSVRGRAAKATVTKMPFVEAKYHKP